jgi:hypothetical protein
MVGAMKKPCPKLGVTDRNKVVSLINSTANFDKKITENCKKTTNGQKIPINGKFYPLTIFHFSQNPEGFF